MKDSFDTILHEIKKTGKGCGDKNRNYLLGFYSHGFTLKEKGFSLTLIVKVKVMSTTMNVFSWAIVGHLNWEFIVLQ